MLASQLGFTSPIHSARSPHAHAYSSLGSLRRGVFECALRLGGVGCESEKPRPLPNIIKYLCICVENEAKYAKVLYIYKQQQ